MVKGDINGFQGLALIQVQIYNPVYVNIYNYIIYKYIYIYRYTSSLSLSPRFCELFSFLPGGEKNLDAEDLVAARKLSGDLNLGARGFPPAAEQKKQKHVDVEEHAMNPPGL